MFWKGIDKEETRTINKMNSLFRRFAVRTPVSQVLRQSFLPAQRFAVPVSPFSTSSSRLVQEASNPKSSVLEKITQKGVDLTPLKLEGDIYAVIKVHNNPFLITEGDKVILPYNLKHAQVGDVLDFYHVTTIGSRNYTFTDEVIDPSLYSIKAVVLEKTKLPMRVTKVTKRRQRKVRHAISKPERTILRVTELKLK